MKLTMQHSGNLGFGGTWNDVLWMSSYEGGDVKRSTALVSSKYDDTSLWIAKQNYDSSSWGTGYLIWHSGNDGSGSGLDADTVDGQHESTFMRRNANSNLDMNNNNITDVEDIYLQDRIYHDGDTNTYMQFHAGDQWRVVTGGTERLEVNNSKVTSAEPIHAPSFHGDGSNLTGVGGSVWEVIASGASSSSVASITVTGLSDYQYVIGYLMGETTSSSDRIYLQYAIDSGGYSSLYNAGTTSGSNDTYSSKFDMRPKATNGYVTMSGFTAETTESWGSTGYEEHLEKDMMQMSTPASTGITGVKWYISGGHIRYYRYVVMGIK